MDWGLKKPSPVGVSSLTSEKHDRRPSATTLGQKPRAL